MVDSSKHFLDKIKSLNTSNKLMASIDVVNLFTNVPVNKTVDIIIDAVYNHQTLSSPLIPKLTLKTLLKTVTTETPFTFENQVYYQIDGVSMGSPLGPTFSNFYMSHLEQTLFENSNAIKKPYAYYRYVDDTFLLVDSINDIQVLINNLESNSVLKFTYEIESECKKLNFLDAELQNINSTISSTVHHKSTESPKIFDFNCYAPITYKKAVLKGELHRTFRICSSYQQFHCELIKLEKKFIDSNFPQFLVDLTIKQFLEKNVQNKTEEKSENTKITFYYKNHY